jgi:hypothetical protein
VVIDRFGRFGNRVIVKSWIDPETRTVVNPQHEAAMIRFNRCRRSGEIIEIFTPSSSTNSQYIRGRS